MCGLGASGAETSAKRFWAENQPGFRFTAAAIGTPEFFSNVERHRYEAEPHILEIAEFDRWSGKDVLEVGCGIGTDGARFARAGARYTGTDASSDALELSRRRFELEALPGDFEVASASHLPYPNDSFDLVYSHGVVHHIHETEGAVGEFYRVLRPGGTALVMVYHRGSLNYRFTILGVRRLMAAALLVPGASGVLARAVG